ncbi:HpcH/HpaI aldolase/citrate lyase family protein [Acidimangrovimonas sediminis]|uniref:HpcH/HpaI aldolase/citrate lyase family protein n=1 Tax=Acidimangrovimonas sediminis TaxID=2056283 RepID=UPI000C7FC8DF|nr:CoA ester lyase [Acidimangrovimonas sediminis]
MPDATDPMQTARSFLFVPGDRPERFDKAIAAGADCTILDLEDAVRPEAKPEARRTIGDWLAAGNRGAVRINPPETEFHDDDLALAGAAGVGAVLLPKAESAEACRAVLAAMAPGVPLLPLIETARGLYAAAEIAAVPGVARLLFGSVDFMSDCGIEDEGDGLRHARSMLVLASAAAGIAGPVDGVTLALDDPAQLAADCSRARGIGMAGKLCIHPRQVAGVNAGFSPSDAEVAQARRIVAAADSAGAKGAIRLDGKLVDLPVVERAHRILRTAEA